MRWTLAGARHGAAWAAVGLCVALAGCYVGSGEALLEVPAGQLAPRGAELLSESGSDGDSGEARAYRLYAYSETTTDEVSEFYQQELEALGWHRQEPTARKDQLFWSDGKHVIILTLRPASSQSWFGRSDVETKKNVSQMRLRWAAAAGIAAGAIGLAAAIGLSGTSPRKVHADPVVDLSLVYFDQDEESFFTVELGSENESEGHFYVAIPGVGVARNATNEPDDRCGLADHFEHQSSGKLKRFVPLPIPR